MKPTQEQLNNREAWFAALLSGKYSQGRSVLVNTVTKGYCCLGVAAEVAGVERIEDKNDQGRFAFRNYRADGSPESQAVNFYIGTGMPPFGWFGKQFGLLEDQGDNLQGQLANKNDSGDYDFARIVEEAQRQFSEYDTLNAEKNI